MKKTFNFRETDTEYVLENTNPNAKEEPFKIQKDNMEFNTSEFYYYVFKDVDNIIEIEIINQTEDTGDKYARLTYQTINEICEGVVKKLNMKLMEKNND